MKYRNKILALVLIISVIFLFPDVIALISKLSKITANPGIT